MKICLTKEFPSSPPKGYFLTKIFHPNVSSSGEICVNTLKQDWNSKMGIRNVLLVSYRTACLAKRVSVCFCLLPIDIIYSKVINLFSARQIIW